MAELDPSAAEVVAFWRDAGPDAWFRKNAEFDAGFHDRFRELHFAAARRELDHWIDHPESALALMILLDQFPRNCFRGTATCSRPIRWRGTSPGRRWRRGIILRSTKNCELSS